MAAHFLGLVHGTSVWLADCPVNLKFSLVSFGFRTEFIHYYLLSTCFFWNADRTTWVIYLPSPPSLDCVWGSCCSNFSFQCSVWKITLCLFLLYIELSALWLTASDYPFGIVKLFLFINILLNIICVRTL
jgi:hypothetical protein